MVTHHEQQPDRAGDRQQPGKKRNLAAALALARQRLDAVFEAGDLVVDGIVVHGRQVSCAARTP